MYQPSATFSKNVANAKEMMPPGGSHAGKISYRVSTVTISRCCSTIELSFN